MALDLKKLLNELIGPEVNNPYTGIVNAQELADKLGITYEEAKSKLKANREYKGKFNDYLKKLQGMGFSLEDLGFQDKQELGRSAFDQYGKRGILSKQGIMNGWEYDWNTGKKRNVITSDKTARDRWLDIDEGERARYDEAQKLRGLGLDTFAKQQTYKNLLAQGLDPMQYDYNRTPDYSYDQVLESLRSGNLLKPNDPNQNKIIRYGDGSTPEPEDVPNPESVDSFGRPNELRGRGPYNPEKSRFGKVGRVGRSGPFVPEKNNGLGYSPVPRNLSEVGGGFVRPKSVVNNVFNPAKRVDPLTGNKVIDRNNFARGPKGKGTVYKFGNRKPDNNYGGTGFSPTMFGAY